PSFAAAHVLLGQMYLYAGRPEEAIEQADKGIRLSPNDPRMFIWVPALAGAHYLLGQYEEAVAAGRRSWSLNRNWPAGRRYGVARAVSGRGDPGRDVSTASCRPRILRLRAVVNGVEGGGDGRIGDGRIGKAGTIQRQMRAECGEHSRCHAQNAAKFIKAFHRL